MRDPVEPVVGRHGVLQPVIAWLAACADATYHSDVAPMLEASCLPCHASGGASGLPLDSLATVRASAPAALAALQSGRMPAGNIDRSGDCGEFTGPAPVSDDDLAVFDRWIEAGLPEGRAVERAVAVAVPFVPDVDTTIGPLVATGEHRCFLVDGGDGAAFLTALRVTAEPVSAVHHAMLFSVGDPTAARTLDAVDAEPGWDCFGGPGVSDAELAAVWTPGEPTVRFPAGTGVALSGGPLVLQLHFGAPGGTVRLELERADGVERALSYHPIAATHFALPPGEAAVTWTEEVPLAAPDLDVFGVMPHLHAMGLGLSLRSPDRCLVDAPEWDYRWQEVAAYRSPVPLASGTPLTMSCSFSTLDAEGITVWGERTTDEMCMAFLLAAPRR